MTEPKMGDKATCKMCNELIEYIGPYWRHVGEKQPRHPAFPKVSDNEAQYKDDSIMGFPVAYIEGRHDVLSRIREKGLIEPFINAIIEKLDLDAVCFNSAIGINPYSNDIDGWRFAFALIDIPNELIFEIAKQIEDGK